MKAARLRRLTVVYDNGGRTFDRYTVVMLRDGLALGLSHNPDSPQGFSQFCDCEAGPHLGTRITWAQLPDNVRAHAVQRLTDD